MGHESRPDAILIAGPTASGKSALALEVAERVGGLIVNADSMQVYADLRILTARPDEADELRVPHALYGTVDGAEVYSVARWLADAVPAIQRAERDGLVPIVVGGTGLYFKALTQGLSEIPSVPAAVRDEWRAWAHDRSADALHAELARRDPETAARLRPTDPQRVLRALEVHAATGTSLSAYQNRPSAAPLGGRRLAAHVLDVDRSAIRERVDTRLDRMVDDGALDEVRRLGARCLDPSRPIMRALAVPQLLSHVRGEIALADALAGAKAATRAYLKRQSTFFRHQLPTFEPIAPEDLRRRTQ